MFFTSVWCKTYQTKSGLSKRIIDSARHVQQLVVMENNYQGDLADIFRGGSNSTSGEPSTAVPEEWQFPYSAALMAGQGFGDPFCNLRDPLFHDVDMMQPSSSLEQNDPALFGDSPSIKRRGNMFSRKLDVPCNNTLLPNHDACLLENSALHISSPRNTPIKRRKSLAKKVVCIPAAAPANSRQGGEVVPSDLWAWRKYGQKPIKGSPYPRGYYRCSSSKGCSARKQVERSRTDPNMLVITYTSEHNHPWPTQRNALAGSTRSQTNNSKHTNNIVIPNNPQSQTKEDGHNDNNNVEQVNPKVKEEVGEEDGHQQVKNEFSKDSIYQPILPDSSNQCHEDFFADLIELEADPLKLLFSKTLWGEINQVGQKKGIDSFDLYDWSKDDNHI